MVSKKHPNTEEYLKKFDNTLKTIKENGKYEEIIKKYGIIQ